MIRCTNIEGFVADIDAIDSDNPEVVISVLENFISKAGKVNDGAQGPGLLRDGPSLRWSRSTCWPLRTLPRRIPRPSSS
jgi:hypothetical protein